MEILGVHTDRVWLELAAETNARNRVDLLTGPNGSGKSEILSFLANTFRGGKSKPPEGKIFWRHNWDNSYEPERVIAQTYSPFTRFPPPVDQDNSLTKIYAEGSESSSSYICAGLHRSTRLVSSSLSKNTLEQSIYRLSESPDSVGPILRVLDNLNLLDRFDFTYEARHTIRPIRDAILEGRLLAYLEAREKEERGRPYLRSGLAQELRRENIDSLTELLLEAFEVLGEDIFRSKVFHRGFGSIGRGSRYDFAALQSLALLRRLDLLTLRRCELTTKNGERLDVANTSSGQQQLLCSVIGLATSLTNNSLVLIDEPELSLHPKWQQLYLDSLYSTLEPYHGCQVLIATHSPLIVQRGSALGAGINQVKKEGMSETVSPDSASIEATLQDVFDTPVVESVHLANHIFSLITAAESDGVRAKINAFTELQRLKELYATPDAKDYKSLKLIQSAMDLLVMGGKDDA